MTDLVVRRLLIDLAQPLPRHWNGGDAFRTAFFNALSMSFPAGEQLFIDSVQAGLAVLPPLARERWADEIQNFIGQEAVHRRVHGLFNAQLQRQGLVNHWDGRIRQRLRRLDSAPPALWVAATAAAEHLTAILARHLLSHPAPLAGAAPAWRDMWLWHASEESEHRATAFNLYRVLQGSEAWRRRFFWITSLHFVMDVTRQTCHNLWRDGSWWRPSTWLSGARLLLGREGLVWALWSPWRAYLRADFHPSEQDDSLARAWLQAHADIAPPLRPAGPWRRAA